MLKYLIIPLTENAVSFCHYKSGKNSNEIIPDLLRVAIKWAMKVNVSIQILYPKEEISHHLIDLLKTVSHADIVPFNIENLALGKKADIVVFDNWEEIEKYQFISKQGYVIKTSFANLVAHREQLIFMLLEADRVNIVIDDVAHITEEDLNNYRLLLHSLIPVIVTQYLKGHQVQLNLLTDRIMLEKMNNCNAGYESITLAPDGNFYACPAFYIHKQDPLGNIHYGLDIRNSQLYNLTYAPICRVCDAWQCKRCIWLNKQTTGELNTPGHEQCVISHIERNASQDLLTALRKIDPVFQSYIDIPNISYLDPFDKIINSKN